MDLEHVTAFASKDHDVTVSAAERHRLHQALVAQVTHCAFVGEVPQVLGFGRRGRRRPWPASGSLVRSARRCVHAPARARVPRAREVEAASDDVTRVAGALLAIARFVTAGASAATEIARARHRDPVRRVQVRGSHMAAPSRHPRGCAPA